MKIATQLLSTTPAPVAKTGDSLDDAAAFQGILTVATAKGASSKDVPQTKSKSQTQDAKLQASDSKKKFVASDSTAAAIPARDLPAPKALAANALLHTASSLTPNQAATIQSSSQTLNDSNACAQLADGIGLFKSSTASILPVIQLPTGISTISRIDQEGNNGTLPPTASSKDVSAIPTNNGPDSIISKAVLAAPVIDETLPPTASKEIPALRANVGTEGVISNATSLHPELQATQLTTVPSHESQVQIPSTTVPAAPVIGGPLQPTLSLKNITSLPANDGTNSAISDLTSSHLQPQATQPATVPSHESQVQIPSATVSAAPVIGGTLPTTPSATNLPAPPANDVMGKVISNATSSHPESQVMQATVDPSHKLQGQIPSTTLLAAPIATSRNISSLPANYGPSRVISNVPSSHPETQATQLTATPSQQPQGSVPSTTASAAPATPELSPAAALSTSVQPIVVVKNTPSTSAAVQATASFPSAASAETSPALPIAVRTVEFPNNAPAPQTPVPSAISAVAIAAAPVVSTMPVSQPVAPKAPAANQTATVSKTDDSSNPNAPISAVDSTTLATQQAAVAVVQSVAAPVALPNFSFLGESQALPAAAANQTRVSGNSSDMKSDASSRQANSAMKAKPGSGTSALGNRFAESGTFNTQPDTTLTPAATLLSKITEPSAISNQGASPSNSTDIANLQQVPQPISVDGTAHSLQPSQTGSVSAETTLQSAPPQAVPDSQQMQGVSSAQLIQSMRSSEMKLGMQSAEFGNISISTSLNHQAISAQISIDHSELGRALSAHLPAIEEKLGSAYGVQAKVELRESNNPASSNDSGYSNSGQQSREQRQSQGGGNAASQGATFEHIAARASFAAVSPIATVSRLDIRI